MGWMLLGAVVLTVFYWRKEMKMTSSTTGEVLSATDRERIVDDRRRDETVVVAKFTVAGKEYEVTHVFEGKFANRFPAGRSVPVRYNPSDPGMARIPTG